MQFAKRQWALIAAFAFYMVFVNTQYAYIRTSVSIEKMTQVNVFSSVGYLFGILILSMLFPMRDLRSVHRAQIPDRGCSKMSDFGTATLDLMEKAAYRRFFLKRGPKLTEFWNTLDPAQHIRFLWKARLALVGAFYLPNIIVNFLGQRLWLESSFLSAFMAIGNAAAVVMISGCFFTFMSKNRIFWSTLAHGLGTFLVNLSLGSGRDLLQPYLFAAARITMTLSGVMLFVFLSGIQKQKEEKLPQRNTEEEERQKSPASRSPPTTSHSFSFLFPILAAFVIFWTNSFTNQIFLPKLYNLFAPGFNVSTVAPLLAMPMIGFFADHWWRRFLSIFIHLCSFLFLLAPSLLLFSNSHLLFMILYTLSIIMIQMIVLVFPFLIVDMYWSTPEGAPLKVWGGLAWLLPVTVHTINANATLLIGPFRSFSIDNSYTAVLLTLAAVVFFLLSRKSISSPPGGAAADTIPANSRTESFKVHRLTEREIEVAELILHGLENDEIKEKIFVSLSTVKMHVGSILKKYKLKRRTEFIAMFIEGRARAARKLASAWPSEDEQKMV